MESNMNNLENDRVDNYISVLNQSMKWCLSLALLGFIASLLNDKGIKVGDYTFSKEVTCILIGLLHLAVCYQQNKMASFFLAFINGPSKRTMLFSMRTHPAFFNPFYEVKEDIEYWHSQISALILPIANMVLLSFVLYLYSESTLPYLLNTIPDPGIDLIFPGFIMLLGVIVLLMRDSSKKYVVLLEECSWSKALGKNKVKFYLITVKGWFVLNILVLLVNVGFVMVEANWIHIFKLTP